MLKYLIPFCLLFISTHLSANFDDLQKSLFVVEKWDDENGQAIQDALKRQFGIHYGLEHEKVRAFIKKTLDFNADLKAQMYKLPLHRQPDFVTLFFLFEARANPDAAQRMRQALFTSYTTALDFSFDKDLVSNGAYGGIMSAPGQVRDARTQLVPISHLLHICFFFPDLRCQLISKQINIAEFESLFLPDNKKIQKQKTLTYWLTMALVLGFDNGWFAIDDVVEYLFKQTFYQNFVIPVDNETLHAVQSPEDSSHDFIKKLFLEMIPNFQPTVIEHALQKLKGMKVVAEAQADKLEILSRLQGVK